VRPLSTALIILAVETHSAERCVYLEVSSSSNAQSAFSKRRSRTSELNGQARGDKLNLKNRVIVALISPFSARVCRVNIAGNLPTGKLKVASESNGRIYVFFRDSARPTFAVSRSPEDVLLVILSGPFFRPLHKPCTPPCNGDERLPLLQQ
jgi:hypothetical protein